MYARDSLCANISEPIILNEASAFRSYYINSVPIDYAVPININDEEYLIDPPKAVSRDWVNWVAAPDPGGCSLYMNKAHCYSRFNNLLWDCPYYRDGVKYAGWTFGGMLKDHECGNFFVTAGVQLTGRLWDSPLTDLGPDHIRLWTPGTET
jgi:hypothetical protein